MSNGYSDSLTLDRIDPNLGYRPENCRWATPKQQGGNKSDNKLVEIDGVTRTVKDWSDVTGIWFTTLYKRYKRGIRGRDFIAPPLHWDSESVPAKKVSRKTNT